MKKSELRQLIRELLHEQFSVFPYGTTANYTIHDYPIDNATGVEWDPVNWTANTIDLVLNHPNPCNFLLQRVWQFAQKQLDGGITMTDVTDPSGPGNITGTNETIGLLEANLIMQKFAVFVELYLMVDCGTYFSNLNEQKVNINQAIQMARNIKIDPRAATVIKKMAPRLKNLVSKPR